MASLLRGIRNTSVATGRAPVIEGGQPTLPRPTGPSAGPVRPNGQATFVNESRPAYELGQQHPNPGRTPAGGGAAARRQADNQSNPNRFGTRGRLPGSE